MIKFPAKVFRMFRMFWAGTVVTSFIHSVKILSVLKQIPSLCTKAHTTYLPDPNFFSRPWFWVCWVRAQIFSLRPWFWACWVPLGGFGYSGVGGTMTLSVMVFTNKNNKSNCFLKYFQNYLYGLMQNFSLSLRHFWIFFFF